MNPDYCNRHIYDQSKTRTFTFRLTPPLRSGSRVDFDEFFGQTGLHWLGPTFGLFVSIRHDLYFVCKAASLRSDLLQALYNLVIISYCKVASVQLESLTISDTSYPSILIKICKIASVRLDLVQLLIQISYWLNLLRLVGFPCYF